MVFLVGGSISGNWKILQLYIDLVFRYSRLLFYYELVSSPSSQRRGVLDFSVEYDNTLCNNSYVTLDYSFLIHHILEGL